MLARGSGPTWHPSALGFAALLATEGPLADSAAATLAAMGLGLPDLLLAGTEWHGAPRLGRSVESAPATGPGPEKGHLNAGDAGLTRGLAPIVRGATEEATIDARRPGDRPPSRRRRAGHGRHDRPPHRPGMG